MKKATIVDLGCQKVRARNADNVHSNMTRHRKAKANGIDPEARLQKISRTTMCPKGREKSIGERRSSFVFEIQKKKWWSRSREWLLASSTWQILQEKHMVKWAKSFRSYTYKKKRFDSPNGKRKRNRVQ